MFSSFIQTQQLNRTSDNSSDKTEHDTNTPHKDQVKSDPVTESQNLHDNVGAKESDECSPFNLKPEPVIQEIGHPVEERTQVNERILFFGNGDVWILFAKIYFCYGFLYTILLFDNFSFKIWVQKKTYKFILLFSTDTVC